MDDNDIAALKTDFSEHHVEADGFNIRYIAAGEGPVVVGLHGAGGLRRSSMHAMLARNHRVILFEVPGFGHSEENTRSAHIGDLALTMLAACDALGLEKFTLMGNSFGGRLALWMAVQRPHVLDRLILIAPAAIKPEGAPSPAFAGSHEQRAAMMFAHPERQPRITPPPAEVLEKQQRLLKKLAGPPRDPDLEARMRDLDVPVLVLFGTVDKVVPMQMGSIYADILPKCFVMMVYDAAHAIDSDRPEAVAEAVTDFVARGERFLVSDKSGVVHP